MILRSVDEFEKTAADGLTPAERRLIEATLAMHGGSIPRAARVLDVSPSTLYRKIEAWNAKAG